MSIRGTGILICGMHRSGTSALGGAFDACGAVLRENMPAHRNNPKGFFEKVEVVNLHEEFFEQLGLDGFGLSVKALPPGWEASEAAERTRIQIAELVERDFGNEALWAVKDPRLCRLAPLWIQALPGVDLRVALAVRHPMEVAESLLNLRQSGYSLSRRLFLWLRFVLEAERNTRGMKRTVVRYEDLIESPMSVMERVEKELELRWPNPPEVRAEKLKNWVDMNLNRNTSARHFASKMAFDAMASLCLEVYGLFHPESVHRNLDRLNVIWEEVPALEVFDGTASLLFQNGPLLGVLSLTTNFLPNIWQKIGAVNPGWRKRAIADINGDGIPDIIFQNGTLIGALIMNASGAPSSWVGIGSMNTGWELCGAAYITGDGNLDLIFQNGTLLGFLEVNSSGAPVSWTGIGAMGSGWQLRAVANLTGNGRPGLIFQNGTLIGALQVNTSGAPTAWTGIGAMSAGWTLSDAVDVTGSGQPDLIFQNGTSIGALEVNTSFQPVAWHGIGAMGSGWTLPGDY